MSTTKKILLTTSLLLMVLSPVTVFPQNTEQNKDQVKEESVSRPQSLEQNQIHGSRFIDVNGDGYRDNAPDLDGDGIPNGRDKDYVKNRGGNGQKGFLDLNSDGINDRLEDSDGNGIADGKESRYSNRYGENGQMYKNGEGSRRGNMWGPNDGTGNKGIGPQNGTGYGPGGGSGSCNGNGPKRGGRK